MRSFVYFIVSTALVFSLSGEALGKNEKGTPHEYKNSDIVWQDDKKITIAIGERDRDIIQSYLKNSHTKKCPPGLAKKNNGCLPPGIAKKYRIGYPLGNDVTLASIAEELLKVLNPAPRGYKYVQVDKDILLISDASKKVIDAVTLLSAVGN